MQSDVQADAGACKATNAMLKQLRLPIEPDFMSKATLKEYRSIVGILSARRVLTAGDGMALLAMFRHYEAAQIALRNMDEKLLVPDDRGVLRKTPAAQVFKDNSLAFLRYAVEFGLTPSSRARQGAEVASEEGDAMAELIRNAK